MSEPLRRALHEARLSEDEVARRLGVDPKTVRRWIKGRTPYPRHRSAVAALLSLDENDLWPNASPTFATVMRMPADEVVKIYPHRWAVPREAWQRLFEGARHEIGILVYAGLFLAEDTGLLRLLAEKAEAGVNVRMLLGDPDSPHVNERGDDEGVGDSLAAKIRNARVLYQPLRRLDRIEMRSHDTVLYNSIFRADDDLLINPHTYGVPASQAPVLHLRRIAEEGMAGTYLNSFQQVWLHTGSSFDESFGAIEPNVASSEPRCRRSQAF